MPGYSLDDECSVNTTDKIAAIYPRPVREILLEVADLYCDTQAITRSFLVCALLPWINNEAVANETQEQAIGKLAWSRLSRVSEDQTIPLITLLNTLRG